MFSKFIIVAASAVLIATVAAPAQAALTPNAGLATTTKKAGTSSQNFLGTQGATFAASTFTTESTDQQTTR